MIVNLSLVMTKLDASSFHFYPTGSQFFGNKHPKSDFDFMVSDSETVRTFLEGIGFKPLKGKRYQDLETTEIYFCKGDEVNANGYHVQLCKNISLKIMTRDYIRNHMLSSYISLSKANRREMWNGILLLMRSMEEQRS